MNDDEDDGEGNCGSGGGNDGGGSNLPTSVNTLNPSENVKDYYGSDHVVGRNTLTSAAD